MICITPKQPLELSVFCNKLYAFHSVEAKSLRELAIFMLQIRIVWKSIDFRSQKGLASSRKKKWAAASHPCVVCGKWCHSLAKNETSRRHDADSPIDSPSTVRVEFHPLIYGVRRSELPLNQSRKHFIVFRIYFRPLVLLSYLEFPRRTKTYSIRARKICVKRNDCFSLTFI